MASHSEENVATTNKEPENDEVVCGGFLLFLFSIFLTMAACYVVAETWTGYNRYQNYTYFYDYDVNPYGALPTVSNVLAAIVIVNTVVGFLSLFLKNYRLLFVNGFISCVVISIIVAVLCLALTMDSDAFLASLNIPVQAIEDPEIEAEVNFIQNTLGCCGSNDYRDYLSVQFPANMSHTIVMKPDESTGDIIAIMLPATCCVNPEQLLCTEMWSTGCKTALVNRVAKTFNIVSVVAGGMMVIVLLTIVFALLAYHQSRKGKIILTKHISMVMDAEEIQKKKQGNHDHHQTSGLSVAKR